MKQDAYKKYQKEQTAIEIQNCLASGMKQLTLHNFKKDLMDRFGLKLDMDPDNYLYKYFNTANPQHYLCATTDAIDETGWSYANINGRFYKEHCIHRTELHREFQQWRMDYFCALRSGHILIL